MTEEYDEWDELIERVAKDLTDQIRREYYMHYLNVVRTLSSPSEKLVYLYLAMFQPQTLKSTRKILGIHENTALNSFNKLITGGHAVRDEHVYWLKKKTPSTSSP